ncbi:2,3-diaminopropionate biosynthesis protein SbnB [Amycolatopsis rubida]|uniref:2,3-diaminopropionate biosynthesis protein SbnB n=1 Tax=Amycolatopsis rubida TaxID=112413 RepID=A0A1I5NF03_9PSEU|nr:MULTISPECIES: 2,3-diaminopropionate biosynthesis protein SbnB [Amycolatopsis]MYW92892.1 2,3-diaminopropionate biosynthesis protein SbnB [Amycolatopsis rubida]NEC57879.1 2,3-diaminopropionate biosynthesis protein SbnB [Amycolatopsis rubida]OAP21613.1 Alanine dehydrogenase [Amycolatopsis sp. M39]SFP20359.1 ornithine cyclodeaminase [Amycolatopsis rubida]
MTETATVPEFAVVSGAQVHQVLDGAEKQLAELIEAAYRLHGQQATVNPPSYFLRFPDRPSARIIALPASVGGEVAVDGVKWISSFPENVRTGLPRASAVLILNDQATGYPLACMESSIISASRTAASAALAADWLSRRGERPRRLGFVGTGLIARYVHRFLLGTGWDFDETAVFDLSAEHAAGFRGYLESTGASGIAVRESAEELIRGSDLIVFATVAGEPHVHDPAWFSHNPLVLNVSLRDLSTEVILASANVVDDVEHCLKANTSVHLAEQATGGRDFLDGTLFDVLTGALALDADRPLVFSPFGLGVLDLAVGKHVLDELRRRGELHEVGDFFFELDRYGQR